MVYPLSLDTAITLVSSVKVIKMNEFNKATTQEEKNILKQEIQMLSKEEYLLYSGEELVRLSIMDKADKVYSPFLKKHYES